MANIHIKSAWQHIRRAPFQALAALFVLGITFFVITFLAVVIYSSNQLINYFETRPQVIAFLNDDATEEQVFDFKTKLEDDTRVKEVVYVSKEQALEIYKRATSDNPLLSELVSPSIFPASLEVSLTDLSYAEDIISEIKDSGIAEQVGFTASLGGEDTLSEVISRLRTLTWYVKVGGGAFALLLASTSFLVLIIIIGMRMTARRDEIEILDLIGATAGFIRNPIILEAVFYSLMGVFLGWIVALIAVLYSTPTLLAYFGNIPILPRDTLRLLSLFGIILAGELVVGLFLALTGSVLAVSRVKRKR